MINISVRFLFYLFCKTDELQIRRLYVGEWVKFHVWRRKLGTFSFMQFNVRFVRQTIACTRNQVIYRSKNRTMTNLRGCKFVIRLYNILVAVLMIYVYGQ